MQVFQEFGKKVEAAWRDVDHSEEKFPALAAEFLRKEKLPSKVTAWEILEWGLKQTELPRQKDVNSNFGDPAITLYVSPKFHIDVYFWFDGTTAIHQHGFCGAFQVLHGSSIHSWYDFKIKERINSFTQIGRMDLKVCELLETGAVRRYFRADSIYTACFISIRRPRRSAFARTKAHSNRRSSATTNRRSPLTRFSMKRISRKSSK